MAEHEHGSMEISGQEKTFDGFLKFVGYGLLGAASIVFFLYLVNG